MLAHPWYATIVICHVVTAVIGFGALGMTGAYARLVRVSPDPYRSEAIARYFRPGSNLAARAIYLVPVFGGIALGFSRDTGKIFPYLGAGIWVLATGLATGLAWPAEARIQRLLAAGRVAEGAERGRLEREAVRCERAIAATSVLFVAALVVMIAQPA